MTSIIDDMAEATTSVIAIPIVIGLGLSLFCGVGLLIIPPVIAWQMGRYNKGFGELDGVLMSVALLTGLCYGCGSLWGFGQAIGSDSAAGAFFLTLFGQAIFYAVWGAILYGIYKWGQSEYNKIIARIEARKTDFEKQQQRTSGPTIDPS